MLIGITQIGRILIKIIKDEGGFLLVCIFIGGGGVKARYWMDSLTVVVGFSGSEKSRLCLVCIVSLESSIQEKGAQLS